MLAGNRLRLTSGEGIDRTTKPILDKNDITLGLWLFLILWLLYLHYTHIASGDAVQSQLWAVAVIDFKHHIHRTFTFADCQWRADMFCLKAEKFSQWKILFRTVLLQLPKDSKAPLLCGLHMGFGKTGFTFLKLLVQAQQLPRCTEFPEVIQADQNVDGARIKSRIHGHIIQQIGETGILIVAHAVQRLSYALSDMLDGGQCIGDGVGIMIEVVIPIVLTESTGCNTNSKCSLHLSLDLRYAILIAFVCIAGQERRVVFLWVMRLQPCAIEGIKGNADCVTTIEAIAGGIFDDLPNLFSGGHIGFSCKALKKARLQR